jgi:hypothetical protein
VADLDLIGTMLSSKEPRPCGLCGQFRKPTRTHVPPQVAGNATAVRRAPDVIDAGRVRRPGRWSEGGMWVRGLCMDCNNLAGRTCDRAYADFAAQIGRMSTPFARSMQVIPNEAPCVVFAPQLVARCVLFGMFGINPRLRVIFPDLADDLVRGADLVRWPDKATLRVGYTHPAAGRLGLLSSGMWMMRVLTERVVHFSFADIVFPPLVWFLVSSESSGQLGPQITLSLSDASDWIRYSPVRTGVDLRSLSRTFPAFLHPMLSPGRDSWVEALSRTGTDTDTVVVFGRIP